MFASGDHGLIGLHGFHGKYIYKSPFIATRYEQAFCLQGLNHFAFSVKSV